MCWDYNLSEKKKISEYVTQLLLHVTETIECMPELDAVAERYNWQKKTAQLFLLINRSDKVMALAQFMLPGQLNTIAFFFYFDTSPANNLNMVG